MREQMAKAIGASSLAKNTLRPIVNCLVGDRPKTIKILSGEAKDLRITIDPRNEKFYWTGSYELPIQQQLAQSLQPGNVFWDIGSHIGFFALIGARSVGPTGQVHAFEPHPLNRQRLEESISLNGFSNISVHPEAVSDSQGTAILHGHTSSFMWSLDSQDHDQEGITVQCITLDNLLAYLGAPDLIKIDAEGFETSILHGAQSLISAVQPSFIVEFTDDQRLAAARPLLQTYIWHPLTNRHWWLQPQGR